MAREILAKEVGEMIDHLSPTQISMFLRCPKQWEFRYVKGIKIPPSGAMVLGSAYHEGLAERFRYVIANDEQPLSFVAIDAFDTAFERIRGEHLVKDEEENLPFDDIQWEQDPGELKDIGVELLQAYEKTLASNIHPVSVEQKEIMPVGDVPIHLITDLTTKTKTIDHKVKKRQFSEDDLRQSLQGTIYYMATGKPLEFHVALKTKVPTILIQRTSRNVADESFCYKQIRRIWQVIQAGIFPPNDQGWHCNEKWCGYWHLCKESK